jgi:tetratricopeptide (TPR) repeat protein
MSSTRLVGRDDLHGEVLRALAAGERLLTLRGPPGVGKSRLARAIVTNLRERGGVVIEAHVASGDDRAALLARLAAAAGLATPGAHDPAALDGIARALDDRGAVLVLDGVDAVRAPVASLVDDLCDATERLAVVACAWQRLGVSRERVIPVTPLRRDDAAALLDHRLARLAAPVQPSARERDALLAWAGGLPLVLEILAAWVASLGAARTLESLAREGLGDDALDRTLDAAWTRLDPPLRDALAALSTAHGSFDADTGGALLGPDAPTDALRRLVDASLVERADDGDETRFALLDSVRDHAARRARTGGTEHTLRERHAEVFAMRPRPREDHPAAWRDLSRAREDLLAAWSWSLARDPARAASLAVTLDPLLVTQGPVALHREVLTETLRALPDDDPSVVRVDLLLALGRAHLIRGRAADAEPLWRKAFARAEALGDIPRAGRCAAWLAFVARARGDLDAVRAYSSRALDVAAATRDARLLSSAEQAAAHGRFVAGDLDGAVQGFRRAVAAARVAKAPRLAGIALTNLAWLHLEGGDAPAAAALNAEARAALRESGDAFHTIRVDITEGMLALRAGRLDAADAGLTDAYARAVAFDDLDGAMEALEALAHLAHRRGDLALAARRVEELEVQLRFVSDVTWPPRLARVRAAVCVPRAAAPALRVSRDGNVLRLGGAPQDLSRRGPLRRVLVALVAARLDRPGEALTAAEVLAAGWPGERMFPESGAARVYMAVRRLRTLGLEATLRTSDQGYMLDPRADIAWDDVEG